MGQGYIVRRLLLTALTLVLATGVIFFALRGVPGDVAVALSAREGSPADAASIASLRAELGLDRPLYRQYLDWLRSLATLDLGKSWWSSTTVRQLLSQGVAVSMELAALALLLSLLVAVPLGVLAAARRDTWVDYLARAFMVAGLAIPGFWMGILVVLGLSVYFHYFPFSQHVPFVRDPLGNLEQFIFPALVLAWRSAAFTGRMVRSSMLEALEEDYVRTARAKGLPERRVLLVHALRNAALPVATVVGFQATYLVAGVVVIEQVFNLPGLGRHLVQGVEARDLPLVQALLLFFVAVTLLGNLAVDLLYLRLDPRVRYR